MVCTEYLCSPLSRLNRHFNTNTFLSPSSVTPMSWYTNTIILIILVIFLWYSSTRIALFCSAMGNLHSTVQYICIYCVFSVGNFSPAMGTRNQVGIGLSYGPASMCSLATQFQTLFLESIRRPIAGLLSFRLWRDLRFLAQVVPCIDFWTGFSFFGCGLGVLEGAKCIAYLKKDIHYQDKNLSKLMFLFIYS